VQQLFLGHQHFDNAPTDERYRKAIRESAIFSTVSLAVRESLRLDLAATNYNQLLMAGLLPAHIERANICTNCHKDRFFSHRGEYGKTGRFPAIMALT
jgi:copper oxidase (laccase) domain-containing protein